jgi:hypothetical protein
VASSPEATPPEVPGSEGSKAEERSPIAVAIEWVSRITTVALMMVLPGVAGVWLDRKLGTSFLALLGFALGVTAGIWQLIVMSRSTAMAPRRRPRQQPVGKGPDSTDKDSRT